MVRLHVRPPLQQIKSSKKQQNKKNVVFYFYSGKGKGAPRFLISFILFIIYLFYGKIITISKLTRTNKPISMDICFFAFLFFCFLENVLDKFFTSLPAADNGAGND